MSKTYQQFQTYSAAAQTDSFVLQPRRGCRALVRSLNATGGNAADNVKFGAAKPTYKTTVNTAAASTATALILDGDTGVKNTLAGEAVAANDYIIVDTAAGLKAYLVGAVNGSGDDDVITISTVTPLDGGSDLGAAVSAGADAWVIYATLPNVLLGAASKSLIDPFIGEVESPAVLLNVGAAAAAHYMSGVVEYVQSY